MLSVGRILADIEAGRRTPASVVDEALERVAAKDPEIKAFVRLAPSGSLAAAREATGPLAGLPFGVKDIFDTADMETEHNSPIYRGHRPVADAALVAILRQKGAAIVGKTATTQFASLDPTTTLNPRRHGHTPGGSSSGSAAAVAAGMLAGACGSQTGGSIVRPASYCGIAGYKPSFRLVPTVGMKTFAWSLDTAGFFAASVDDVALLAGLATGRRLAEPRPASASGLTVGLFRSDLDTAFDASMQEAWDGAAKLFETSGARLVDIEEPAALSAARAAHRVVQGFEAVRALAWEHASRRDLIAPKVLSILDEGATIAPEEYDAARRTARTGRRAATGLFEQCDAILVPSAFGPAPRGLESTGDPSANKLWTLTGNPAVNVPGLNDADGLPLGLSIVTRFGRDSSALAIAGLLETLIGNSVDRRPG